MRVKDEARRAGTLVYDADCNFCSRFAAWSGPAVPWQELDLEAAGTSEREMTSAAGWLEDGRVTATGAAAISEALVRRGGVATVAGRTIALPGVRDLAREAYRVVARNRHRMPGGTPACRLSAAEPSEPRPVVMIVLMLLIAMAGLVGLSLSMRGDEPYPALLQPPFGYNLESRDGTVTTYATRYQVVLPDGSIRPIQASAFIPEAGPAPYLMARVIMSDPVSAEADGTRAWLAQQLDRSAASRGAVTLVASQVAVTYEADTRHEVSRETVPLASIDLRDVR